MSKPLPLLRLVWAFSLCFICSVVVNAQGNYVDVTAELEKGRVYKDCEIVGVTGSKVFFIQLNGTDTLYGRVKTRIGNLILEQKISGSVPDVGDTALIVLDKSKRIKLMAKDYNETYFRFWTPARANVKFKYKRPAIPVPGFEEDIWVDIKGDYYTCEDGCLYPKSHLDADVHTAGFQGPREVHLNNLQTIGLKLSSMSPGIGFELKLQKRLSFSSMALMHFAKAAQDESGRVKRYQNIALWNELRYYYVAIPDKMARKHSKFSGSYFSAGYVYWPGISKEYSKQYISTLWGIQVVSHRFLYSNVRLGYLYDMQDKLYFAWGGELGFYF